MLRKQVTSLTIEIDNSKMPVNELKIKNEELNAKILDLTICLEKFTRDKRI